jgi:hypothetical protein
MSSLICGSLKVDLIEIENRMVDARVWGRDRGRGWSTGRMLLLDTWNKFWCSMAQQVENNNNVLCISKQKRGI